MSPISSSTCAQLKFDILSITSPTFLGSGLTKYVYHDEVRGIRKEVADSVDSQNVKSTCPSLYKNNKVVVFKVLKHFSQNVITLL
jgi:hypothetical protein